VNRKGADYHKSAVCSYFAVGKIAVNIKIISGRWPTNCDPPNLQKINLIWKITQGLGLRLAHDLTIHVS